jgi:hypothetical protein
MWDLPKTDKEGKILHTKITLHPSECVLSKSDAKLWSSSLFNPILIAERVSDKNTGNDFGEWIGEIMKDCKSVSTNHYGRMILPVPVLMKFDCALEILGGVIIGFRNKDSQVDSSAMYSNVLMFHL